MGIYAYISILEALFKLAIAYSISLVSNDKLIIYSILIFIMQLIIRFIYQIYCRKHFEECHFRLFYDKALYKKLSGFAGWNLFGSIAWIIKDQGVNIVLNIFFGPSINAARGVALQVSSTVMNFISNFQIALNPQITKNYANGEIVQMEKLVYTGIKFSYFLLLIISLPICLNIDYILALWLEEVPLHSNSFICLILIDALMGILFGVPMMTSLSATGNIKQYQIVVSSIIIMILPVSYIVLSINDNVMLPFYIIILFTILSGIARFYFCIKQIRFNLKKYIQLVLLPTFIVSLISIPISLSMKYTFYTIPSFSSFMILTSISCLTVIITVWTFGIKNEKKMIIEYIKKKLKY